MKIVRKLKKVLALSDPYPNLGYELFCYIKAAFGMVFIILGFFFIFSPVFDKSLVIFGFAPVLGPLGEGILFWEESVFAQNFEILSPLFGILFVLFGFYFLWRIKLVRKLFKIIIT